MIHGMNIKCFINYIYFSANFLGYIMHIIYCPYFFIYKAVCDLRKQANQLCDTLLQLFEKMIIQQLWFKSAILSFRRTTDKDRTDGLLLSVSAQET
jgi:hypothetical protein